MRLSNAAIPIRSNPPTVPSNFKIGSADRSWRTFTSIPTQWEGAPSTGEITTPSKCTSNEIWPTTLQKAKKGTVARVEEISVLSLNAAPKAENKEPMKMTIEWQSTVSSNKIAAFKQNTFDRSTARTSVRASSANCKSLKCFGKKETQTKQARVKHATCKTTEFDPQRKTWRTVQGESASIYGLIVSSSRYNNKAAVMSSSLTKPHPPSLPSAIQHLQ